MAINEPNDVVGSEPAYKNRSTGLILVGLVLVAIGIGCALLVPLSLLVVSVSGGWAAGGTELRSTVPLLVLYLVAAVAFCWLGVGSIRARRWARDLMVSLSWIWLVTGVCNFLLTLVLLPMLLETVTSDYPTEVVPFISAFVVVFTGVISVLLPGAFLLFYRSPHVAATCRQRGPRRQWTDGLPDRILTFAIVWALMAVSVIVMPAYGWVFPFFGLVFNGASGAVLWITVMAVCLLLAWGGVRRAVWAWRGSVAAIVVAGVSTVMTFLLVDSRRLVEGMQLPPEQATILAGLMSAGRLVEIIFWTVVWGTFLLYVFSVRRFFLQEERDG